ncbi:uncharacterized protein GLRG_07163 [Colletotrichum graminicola M1.001]|uniref:Zn(2)-C6 fungal-type domain-containing protein n=1 Tax=Colletotrichum graminicola (strain M1.001 / M2 / FGSC 10212) TaxID=645133 RepID=E3QMD1_COLGM|nr:uncharacterized protein GLRG_07163 [Colletotrichum graminicola M1.001]EFQ32019.1 hypothetical protein GLRG_07163 [Colletotrichum graminicola M1.001]
MSSNLLNFNKPCSGCRRRKVRCDKAKPCLNCVRHGIPCIYDPQRDFGVPTPESQHQLQDRVDRLERVIEDMRSMSLWGDSQRGLGSAFPSVSPATSHFGEPHRDESMAGDPGMQVYDDNMSYYLGPNHWLNLQDIVFEPRCLFHIDPDKTGKNPTSPSSWPLVRTPALTNLSHLHLEPEKEDILTDLFLAHVEPLVKMCHDAYWRQEITDFRVGVHKTPVDIEAAMFATQAMTVAALPASVVQERLGKSKKDLLRHLQEASQLALERADIMRSRNPVAFFALLYHIQMKFIVGDGEVAVALLGLAGRFGTRLGLHRNPSHYNYSPWIVNMRSRLWSHFELMDNPSYNLEGADSGLPFISDVQPPKNANDAQWVPNRFAKPGSAPPDQDGITDMSFALVRQHLVRTMQFIIRKRNDVGAAEELGRLVDETENFITAKFVAHADGSYPIHAVMASYFRGSIKSMRLLVDGIAARFYQESVEILEEMERGEAVAVQNHWGWLYRWPKAPYLISDTLIGLAQQPKHPITDRAWRQMNIAFRRHNNEDISMRNFAAWRVIEALCDQAMLYHKHKSHQGAWYAQRLDQARSVTTPAQGKPPMSLEHATLDDILGDVQMFGQDASHHGGISFYGPQQDLGTIGYPDWAQPAHSHGQGVPPAHQPPEDSEEI